jgi:EAL domain-containing protein (putative c-di-GMP-specific phosphodiesterase class I)
MIYAPISEVKIDREIMQTIMEKPLIKGFIQSVIHLCKEHDVSVVTEGIENKAMLKTARQMKADKIQGYYYAKPLSYDQALNYSAPESSKQED